MKTKRVVWVDIAKFICIMCVMNSHLESTTEILRCIYTPFFLSLFFFCSGYVYTSKGNFYEFLKKKVSQLFVPWLLFSVLNILLSQILSFNEHGSLKEELLLNFLQIRGHGDGVWFIAALFVAFIPFYFFIRWYEQSLLKNKWHWLLGVSLLLSVVSHIYQVAMDATLLPWKTSALPWHLEYIFIAVFFMVLGYLFREKFEAKFDEYNTYSICIILSIIYLIVVLLYFFGKRFFDNEYINILANYIQQLLGIFAITSICKLIPSNKLVLYIGQNTLLFFALHGKVYSLLQFICKKTVPDIYSAILSNQLASSVFSVVLTILLSLILIIPSEVINRWLPFMAGRKRKLQNK